MKNIILSLSFLFYFVYSNAQSVSTTNTSDLGSCNGTALFLDSAMYDTWTWVYLDSNSVLANEFTGLSGLCIGNYTILATSNGVNSSINFTIGSTINADCSSLNAQLIQLINATSPSNNDGLIEINVIGGTQPYNILWSNGATGPQVTGLDSNYYSVLITDLNGCTRQYSYVVADTFSIFCATFQVNRSTIQNTSLVNCNGEVSYSFSGGTAPYILTPINPSNLNIINNQYATNLCSGHYEVIATDVNGCTDSANFSIGYYNPNCVGFSLTVTTTFLTTNSSCDGTVNLSTVNGTGPFQYYLDGNPINSNLLSSVCEGYYNVSVYDQNNCSAYNQFVIEIDSSLIPITLTVWTNTYNVSANGICDGSVTYNIYGGVSPYTIVNNTTGLVVGSSEYNLCEGIYSYTITDAVGTVINLNYFIASPNNIITNYPYLDSTNLAILTNGTLESCTIDYLSLDTAFVSNIQFINADSIVVTWSIIDTNGITDIVESYNINGLGIYELILQIFCPQRATEKYLIVKQQVLLNGSQNSITENVANFVSVYPNPVNDVLTINIGKTETNTISVTDISGKIVYQNITQTDIVTINFADFAKGQYILTIENTTGVSTHKLVK